MKLDCEFESEVRLAEILVRSEIPLNAHLCLTLMWSTSQSWTHLIKLFGNSTLSCNLHLPRSSSPSISISQFSKVCCKTCLVSFLVVPLSGLLRLCNSWKLQTTFPTVSPFRKGTSVMSIGIDDPKGTALFGILIEYSTLSGQTFSTDYKSMNVKKTKNSRGYHREHGKPTIVCDSSNAPGFKVRIIRKCYPQKVPSAPAPHISQYQKLAQCKSLASAPFSQWYSAQTGVFRPRLLADIISERLPALRLTREDLGTTGASVSAQAQDERQKFHALQPP